MSKHTTGPLFVRQVEKFPFDIQIVNASGEVIFFEGRYAYGTCQETVEEVLAGSCFNDPDKRAVAVEANARQLANAYLRAAAPELLAALKDLTDDIAERFDMESRSTNPGMVSAVSNARAAIAKAEGGV